MIKNGDALALILRNFSNANPDAAIYPADSLKDMGITKSTRKRGKEEQEMTS